jgi:hypothetical protein
MIHTRQIPPLILPKKGGNLRPKILEINLQLPVLNPLRNAPMLPLPLELFMPIRPLLYQDNEANFADTLHLGYKVPDIPPLCVGGGQSNFSDCPVDGESADAVETLG